MKKTGAVVQCHTCKKDMYCPGHKLRKYVNQYCGHKCKGIGQRTVPASKKCLQCSVEFVSKDIGQLCCSKKCSNINRRSGDFVECLKCNTKFYRPTHRILQNKRYCSKTCWYSSGEMKGRDTVKRNLARASKMRVFDAERLKQMSEQTKRLFKEGKIKKRCGASNNLWKGGIATLQNVTRNTPEYKEWRNSVYERDGYSCQHCGTNKDLHAHHVKTFSESPELRFVVSNGITVCRTCHGIIHGRVLPDISNANRRLSANK